MPRRIHIAATLRPGHIELDPAQAHHARDALRLTPGSEIEAFDDAGHIATGTIVRCDAAGVTVRIGELCAVAASTQIVVASAVPKGARADWMIEKLSELGVARFIPLATARSVVLPAGQNKRDRWIRIATESAKQSHRPGVMQIEELTPLDQPLAHWASHGLFLSTHAAAEPIVAQLNSSFIIHHSSIALFIGPEGGWTDDEMARFNQAGLTGVKLTATILRVETAAVAAAAVVATLLAGDRTDIA